MVDRDNLKTIAGETGAEYVTDGMVVGLGTGSTVYYTLIKLGRMIREGLSIVGIPTSLQTERIAKEQKIRLSMLEEHTRIDVTIDGADEVDPNLNLIKGLGGALVREKVVAKSSERLIIVVDDSKLVEKLGTKSSLPVEVVPFAWASVLEHLNDICSFPNLRREQNDDIFLSDNGNYIIDCAFEGIDNPEEVEREIKSITGVIDSGLFIGIANTVIVGSEGGVRVLCR